MQYLPLPNGRVARREPDGRYALMPLRIKRYIGSGAWALVTPDEWPRPGRRLIQLKLTRQGANGIGDHATVLLGAEGLRRQYPDADVVIVSRREDCVPWAALWWPDVWYAAQDGHLEVESTAIAPLDTRPMGRHKTERWRCVADNCGTTLAIPPLRPLSATVVDAVREHAGAVVLFPEANSVERPWPIPAWRELERLLLAHDYPVVVAGGNADGPRSLRSPKVIGRSPAEVAALIRGASLVIGNDSGPAHLGGLIGTPTLALCGIVGGRRVFGAYPSVRWIDGPLPCTGCEWDDREFEEQHCKGMRCASLALITPAQVMDAVRDMVRPRQRRGDGLPTLEEFQALPATFDLDTVRRPGDEFPYWHTPTARRDTYAAKERVARLAQPKRILEIGVRAGYAAAAFLHACPDAVYVGIDKQNDPHISFGDYLDYARAMLARQYPQAAAEIRVADSQEAATWQAIAGPFDLIHIDGDHFGDGPSLDLQYAAQALAPGGCILVDDYMLVPDVRAAAERFLSERGWSSLFIPTPHGDLLMRKPLAT